MTWPLSGHLALGLATGLTCGIAASRYPDVIEPPYAAVKRRSQNLERHGDQAVTKAREIVRTLKARGDDDGADTWLRIIVAIETTRQEPSGPHPAPNRG